MRSYAELSKKLFLFLFLVPVSAYAASASDQLEHKYYHKGERSTFQLEKKGAAYFKLISAKTSSGTDITDQYDKLLFDHRKLNWYSTSEQVMVLLEGSEPLAQDLTDHGNQAYPIQAMRYLQAGQCQLTDQECKDEGLKIFLDKESSLCTFISEHDMQLDKLGIAYPSSLAYALGRPRPRLIHLLANIYSKTPYCAVRDRLESEEVISAWQKLAQERAKWLTLLQTPHLVRVGISLTVVFVVVSLCYHVFAYLVKHLYNLLTFPSVITETSYPTTIRAWLQHHIHRRFGIWAPQQPVSRLKELVHSENLMQKTYKIIEQFRNAAVQNKYAVRQGQKPTESLPHLLFFGPPGGGKSMTMKAIAATLLAQDLAEYVRIDGADPAKVSAQQISDSWSKIESKAKATFLKTGKTTLVLIDEIDQAFGSHLQAEVHRNDRLNTSKVLAMIPETHGTHMCFLGTTNFLLHQPQEQAKMDPALLNRFLVSNRIYVGSPSMLQKRKIFDLYLKKIATQAGLQVQVDSRVITGLTDYLMLLDMPRQIEGWVKELVGSVAMMKHNVGKRRKKVATQDVQAMLDFERKLIQAPGEPPSQQQATN